MSKNNDFSILTSNYIYLFDIKDSKLFFHSCIGVIHWATNADHSSMYLQPLDIPGDLHDIN